MTPDGKARTVGVIGGMGPAATVHFMARVLALTPADTDQDHVRLIVDNNGAIPDRNLALRGEGPSPGPLLADMARGLERAGAQLLVMPCNTAHAYAAEVRAATTLPFIDLIEATCAEALAPGAGATSPRRIGVLAADGCRRARLYPSALARRGREALTCDEGAHALFMALLYRIKAGDLGPDVRAGMRRLAEGLVSAGADVIVAGCTEVPLVLGSADLEVPLIDSIDALARATIKAAKG
jgi:aspartate racemase